MNKEQWREYRRNWRLVQASLYVDESPIPYARRLQIEEHFKKAKDCQAPFDHSRPSKLMYMWNIGQRVRKLAVEESIDFDPVCVANAARAYMRRNTQYDGRKAAGEAYPVYWSHYKDWS